MESAVFLSDLLTGHEPDAGIRSPRYAGEGGPAAAGPGEGFMGSMLVHAAGS